MNGPDFIAIGDIVTDDFIRLKEASVHCEINNENCTICMRWGDKIPFEFAKRVAGVGNGPNASVAAARLGLTSQLLVWMGNDENGHQCLAALKENGVDTSLIHPIDGAETNQHYVLWYEAERTILIKHNTYPYHIPEDFPAPKTLYLTSLGEAATPLYDDLAKWLPEHPEVQFVFQPGTFQIRLGTEKLAALYHAASLVICNKEESQLILKSSSDDIKELLAGMRALGPKIALITDGYKGAYADDGTNVWFVPAYPDPKEPYERTGAGDAFASTVAAALAMGKSLEEALLWGPVNSMGVVQKIGAQEGLLTKAELEDWLAKAPADYVLKKL
jgi:sugar/nucleoside kinase (ribokinase family)